MAYKKFFLLLILATLMADGGIFAQKKFAVKTYYVAPSGSDKNTGTFSKPFRTIQKAASEMQAGDTCLVRTGVYREWVKPLRSGTSEKKRITYKAYPGENPVIKGSERITSWKSVGNGVWKVDLPVSFFGDFNPYTMPIYGDLKSKYKLEDKDIWMDFGQQYHLGDVYSNGHPFFETLEKEKMSNSSKTWYTETSNGITSIWAHFDVADPNQQLTEINVRECIFFPDTMGLKYITVNGFTMQQAACYWAAPNSFQKALIGTYLGKSWIIENCHITDAKCVGIVSGNVRDHHSYDINEIGHHIVRNNVIERCGEAAIAGLIGFAASRIENNLIQDINYKMQFGGQETAGIKVHRATDLIIKNNIIRHVFATGKEEKTYSHFPGIWIDWSNQGTRISGNVIYDIDDYTIYVEANHGPLLIDNNVLVGSPIGSESERVILAHNLFYKSGLMYMNRESRNPDYYEPHTLHVVKPEFITKIEDRYYNNIFIGRGPDKLHTDMSTEAQNVKDFRSGYNLYYGAIKRQPWDMTGMEDTTFKTVFKLQELANGVKLQFSINKAPLLLQCPLITTELIGNFSLVKQGMEQPDGSGLRIDKDALGNRRDIRRPKVGPFEKLKAGINSFALTAGSPL